MNAGDNFGISVAGVGDVNGDAIPDIAIGAPFTTVGDQVLLGTVFVFSGANGAIIHRIEGDPETGTRGGAVAGTDDINGDGVPDIIVGAAAASPPGLAGVGSVLVYSGATGSSLLRLNGVDAGEAFGELVASAGDVNADGVPDILVGLPKSSRTGLFTAGSVLVFSGADGNQLLRFDGSIEFANFGSAIASAGDVNGDGRADIVVGDPFFELFNGRVLVYSGLDGAELWRVENTANATTFGSTVASAGDVNRDGVPDILVGDPGGNGLTGSVFLLSGLDGTLLLRIDGLGGGFGSALASVGDINGDQIPDIIVGAKNADPADLSSAGNIFAVVITDPGNRTIVQISTSLGDFSIELFDELTPITVANFLSYVNSGAYNGTFIHRSEPNFVIQGGWLVFNEPGISNTRGTLAMAKVGGDPNSATSQWFVNIGNNSSNLDEQNGGFTAFARVLDNGMEVVDAINALPRAVLVNGAVDNAPVVNYNGLNLTAANLVELSMSVVLATANEPNSFDNSTGLLNVSLDAGATGLFSLSFSLFANEPAVVIQAQQNTIVSLPEAVSNMATFDDASGQLVIPALVIDGAVAFRNIIFQLSDVENLLFTLVSFE